MTGTNPPKGPEVVLATIDEFDLIGRVVARFPAVPSPGVGPGDDAAFVLPTSGVVLSTDTLVEEVHFSRRWFSPEDVGWKAVAVNVSDLLSMGATPRWFLLSLSLPGDLPVGWIDRMADGMADCAGASGMLLIGGNMARSFGGIQITVTVVGQCAREALWRRSAARPGDKLALVGSLGSAAAGLHLLQQSRAGQSFPSLERAQLRPKLQLDVLDRWRALATPPACIDVSDGFVQDLRRVLSASGVGARVELERLAVDPEVERCAEQYSVDPWSWVLNGGEDYSLIMAAAELPPGVLSIGQITAGPSLELLLNGKPYQPARSGFRHFGEST